MARDAALSSFEGGRFFLGLEVSLKGQGFELRCSERLFLSWKGH
jgi:hypothetical protein